MTLPLRRLSPDHRRVVLCLHGVMSHAGWFEPLAVALSSRGIGTAALDRRGSGEAVEAPGREDAAAWVADVVEASERLAGEGRLVSLLGWCWGARLAIVAASRSLPIERLLLAAPGLAMSAMVRERAAAVAAEAGDGERVALPFGVDAFSREPAVRDWIDRDPRRWRSQPRAFLAPSRALAAEALARLPALALPTFALLARGDEIVDNAETLRLLAGRKTETIDGGHAVILERPDAVAARLAEELGA